ncbi:MAG: PolC-type DNA polymerase III [Bacillota bacterium]
MMLRAWLGRTSRLMGFETAGGDRACDSLILTEVKEKLKKFQEQRHHPQTPLREMEFVVFDLETTGLYPFSGDTITSIGAVLIKNGEICPEHSFQELVNPGRPIPPLVTQITGIDNEMVAEADDFLTVFNRFLDFCGNRMLIAHNSDFDLAFINIQLKKALKTKFKPVILDTVVLAMALQPYRSSYTLDSLCTAWQIKTPLRHTALGDALITSRLFLTFLQEFQQRGIKTVGDLLSLLHWRNLL